MSGCFCRECTQCGFFHLSSLIGMKSLNAAFFCSVKLTLAMTDKLTAVYCSFGKHVEYRKVKRKAILYH